MPLTLYSMQLCCQWLPPVLELPYRGECRIRVPAQDASQARAQSQLTSTALMQTSAQGKLWVSPGMGHRSQGLTLCVLSQNILFFLLNILWMWPEHCEIKLHWVILMKSWRLEEKIQEVFKGSASISHCVAAAEIKFWLILFKSSSKWLYWSLIISGFF